MTNQPETRPSWRRAARIATMQKEMAAAQTRSQVICALNRAVTPLSIGAIANICGISYGRAWRALETLAAMHAVALSGPKNNQRFALNLSGTAMEPGGPASGESAAEGCAGSSASAARPGRAA